MGKLHFIGGEKGGVGKSMTARLLAQYYIDNQKPFIGFDSDQSHNTFSRFYAQFTAPVYVDRFESMDDLIETAEHSPNSDIIVDLAAQTSRNLNKWMQDCDLLSLTQELGFDVYLWHVMDDSADAMHLLHDTLQQYKENHVQFVIVQNYGRGENFEKFQQSPTYQLAQEKRCLFVELGRLHNVVAQKIDFANMSFWAAANNRDDMKLVERQRVKVWLKNQYTQLERFLNFPQLQPEQIEAEYQY